MKTIYCAAIAFALLATVDVHAFAAEPAAKPAVADSSDDEEDAITCKSEGVTGSRVKKRTVCSSEKQRREEREKTGSDLEGIRVQGTTQRSNGG